MDPEKIQEKQPENTIPAAAEVESAAPVTERAITEQPETPRKKDSSQVWNSISLILLHLLFAIVIVGGIYWLVERHEYNAEHVIAAPDRPVQIYYTPNENAAKAAANYLAFSMEQKLGLEAELITEREQEFHGISILCGSEATKEPDQKAIILFASALVPANAQNDPEDAVYSLELTGKAVSIFVPDRENCFGAVKAITDRWLQADCGITGDGELVIGRAMIDGQLTGLPTDLFGQIRILTQNLRNRDDGEGKSVEERAVRFFQLVEEYQPDLIGTQEATWKWMQLLEKGLSDRYELYGCSRLGPNTQDGEWNTVLFRKDRFTFIDGDTFWLSNTPSESKSKLNYEGAVRICTWALLKDSETGKTLLFCNTHLQNTLDPYELYRDVRVRQVEILLQKLRGNGNLLSLYPGILTGDFNGSADEPFYSLVTSVLDDARTTAIADLSDINYSFHDYGKTEWLIDFCFHSPLKITALEYRILDDWYDGYISDHYGVFTTAIIN